MNYRRQVEQLKAQRQLAIARIREEKKALEIAEAEAVTLSEAISVAQQIAQTIQESAHQQIARVVTRCLQAVFGPDHSFQILFERKRSKTEAKFQFCSDGYVIDPLTAASGGMLDVAAFGLRLACLMLSRPRVRKLLVLDEPFKHVSVDYRPAVRDMLEALANELAVQIIMVTHSRELQIGTIVEIE